MSLEKGLDSVGDEPMSRNGGSVRVDVLSNESRYADAIDVGI